MIGRLLLWDVDGTLVRAGPIGAEVFDVAIEDVLGRRPDGRVRMSGKTDPQIAREYLIEMGVSDVDATIAAVMAALERRLAESREQLAVVGSECPGAGKVLEAVAGHRRVVSSVLTGNIVANAVVKLSAFGLDRWLDLEVGAYGSDHEDRQTLVPLAMGRAADARNARLHPSDVWVIGDSPRDLACAQAGGARCLLVATGRSPLDELAALGADAVAPDLSDTSAIVDLLTGDLA